jgi:hypothetical protein
MPEDTPLDSTAAALAVLIEHGLPEPAVVPLPKAKAKAKAKAAPDRQLIILNFADPIYQKLTADDLRVMLRVFRCWSGPDNVMKWKLGAALQKALFYRFRDVLHYRRVKAPTIPYLNKHKIFVVNDSYPTSFSADGLLCRIKYYPLMRKLPGRDHLRCYYADVPLNWNSNIFAAVPAGGVVEIRYDGATADVLEWQSHPLNTNAAPSAVGEPAEEEEEEEEADEEESEEDGAESEDHSPPYHVEVQYKYRGVLFTRISEELFDQASRVEDVRDWLEIPLDLDFDLYPPRFTTVEWNEAIVEDLVNLSDYLSEFVNHRNEVLLFRHIPQTPLSWTPPPPRADYVFVCITRPLVSDDPLCWIDKLRSETFNSVGHYARMVLGIGSGDAVAMVDDNTLTRVDNDDAVGSYAAADAVWVNIRLFVVDSGVPFTSIFGNTPGTGQSLFAAAIAADLNTAAAAAADAEFHTPVPTPQPATQDRESQEIFFEHISCPVFLFHFYVNEETGKIFSRSSISWHTHTDPKLLESCF